MFAEFETNLRRERQLEGIAKAKTEGVYNGRKPSSIPARSCPKAQGLGATEITKRLGIGRATVYRVLDGKWVVEWLKAPHSKCGVPARVTVSSNLTPSAIT